MEEKNKICDLQKCPVPTLYWVTLQTYTEKGVMGNCRLQTLAEDPTLILPKENKL